MLNKFKLAVITAMFTFSITKVFPQLLTQVRNSFGTFPLGTLPPFFILFFLITRLGTCYFLPIYYMTSVFQYLSSLYE